MNIYYEDCVMIWTKKRISPIVGKQDNVKYALKKMGMRNSSDNIKKVSLFYDRYKKEFNIEEVEKKRGRKCG